MAMATLASQDPFYVVKAEVEQSMNGITTLYERWKQLVLEEDSGSEELLWTQNEIKSGIKSIEWDLGDLEETISIVEANKNKYNLDQTEIQARKEFVVNTKRKIQNITDEIDHRKGAATKQQRNQLMSGKQSNRYAKLEESIIQDNEQFIQDQNQRQAQIIRQQDTSLVRLQSTVGTLKEMGKTIGSQLEEHEQIITEIDVEVDKASSGLKGVIKKVNQLIDKTSDGKQMCIIVMLILVLVALIAVVFYV